MHVRPVDTAPVAGALEKSNIIDSGRLTLAGDISRNGLLGNFNFQLVPRLGRDYISQQRQKYVCVRPGEILHRNINHIRVA